MLNSTSPAALECAPPMTRLHVIEDENIAGHPVDIVCAGREGHADMFKHRRIDMPTIAEVGVPRQFILWERGQHAAGHFVPQT